MINYDISKKLSYPFIRRECALRAYHSEKLYNRSFDDSMMENSRHRPSYIFLSIGSPRTKSSEEDENLAVTRAPTLFSNQRFVRVAITVLLTLSKLICFILLPGIRPSVRTLPDRRTKFSRAIRVPVCTLLPHRRTVMR